MGKKKSKANPFASLGGPRLYSLTGLLVLKMFVDLNDETNIFIARVVCGSAFAAMFAIQVLIYFKLRFSQEQRESTVFVTNSILYPDTFGMESKKKEPKFEVTWAFHDQVKWAEQNKKMFMPILIALAANAYYNVSTPLIMLVFTQSTAIYKSELFKVHVLGKDAKLVTSLKRPWISPPVAIPFGQNGFFGKQLQYYKDEMDKIEEETAPAVANAQKPVKPMNKKKARKMK